LTLSSCDVRQQASDRRVHVLKLSVEEQGASCGPFHNRLYLGPDTPSDFTEEASCVSCQDGAELDGIFKRQSEPRQIAVGSGWCFAPGDGNASLDVVGC